MQIFGNVVRGLAGALELHQQRHNVISENLANVETPGYRARDVAFHDALESAFAGEGVAAAQRAETVVDTSSPIKIDGNSVDLDLETTRLADNAFRIVTLSRLIAKKYAGLKETIAELG
jgi:flagellar basal-body rod protein FlgB